MKNLQQTKYEDDNGIEFPAEKIDTLGSYVHVCDGFYSWTCGGCGKDHGDRWHNISGRVLKCDGCKKWVLLVRTETTRITELYRTAINNLDLEEEVKQLREVKRLNEEDLKRIRQDFMRKVQAIAV